MTQSQIREGQRWNWPLKISKFLKLFDRRPFLSTNIQKRMLSFLNEYLFYTFNNFRYKFQVFSGTNYWFMEVIRTIFVKSDIFRENHEKCCLCVLVSSITFKILVIYPWNFQRLLKTCWTMSTKSIGINYSLNLKLERVKGEIDP